MDRLDQPITLEPREEQDRKRRRRRHRLFLLVIAIIVVICIWLWLKTPATGWVDNSATMATASTDSYETVTLDGRYIDLQYVSNLTVKLHDTNQEKGTENIFLHRDSADPATNYSLAIMVLPISGMLNEVSAVRLRQDDHSQYKEATYSDHAGTLFTKNANGYEKTLIWQEYGHTYSVSLTVPKQSPQADEVFTQVMKSVQTTL